MTIPDVPEAGTLPWLDRYTSTSGEIMIWAGISQSQLRNFAAEWERRCWPILAEAVGEVETLRAEVARLGANGQCGNVAPDLVLGMSSGATCTLRAGHLGWHEDGDMKSKWTYGEAPSDSPATSHWSPMPGEVAWTVEAWPFDLGANGHHYSSGCLPAAEVSRELRSLADRIDLDWATADSQDEPRRRDDAATTVIGCPDCGTILNAATANCTGLWHSDNRPTVESLMADRTALNADVAQLTADRDSLIKAGEALAADRDEARTKLARCREDRDEYGGQAAAAEKDAEQVGRRLAEVLIERDEAQALLRLAPHHQQQVVTLEHELVQARAELKKLNGERILSVIFGHHKGAPRPFALYRREDATGVSGTGVVATGAEFEDGMVVLRWSSAFPTSVVFHERGMESVEAIHGHGGKTVVVWLSDELEPLAAMETQRDEARAEVVRLTAERDEARDREFDVALMGRQSFDAAERADVGVMSAATLGLVSIATGSSGAIEVSAEFDDATPAPPSTPESDRQGEVAVTDAVEAPGGAGRVWRHGGCGYETTSPLPRPCPRCGHDAEWTTTMDTAMPPLSLTSSGFVSRSCPNCRSIGAPRIIPGVPDMPCMDVWHDHA